LEYITRVINCAGHGRETIFFTTNGIEVEALDYSVIAVEIQRKATDKTTNL
jgi:hypothetical protein